MADAAQEPERTALPGLSRLSAQGLPSGGGLARSERVGEIVSRLKAGDFEAARYESTPRRRAEILAAVLSKALSRGALRRRLKRIGFEAAWQHADLAAISVEGGGVCVEKDGKGCLLTGPDIDRDLLAVFPELVPHTLTALTTTAGPGASDTNVAISNPNTSGSNALYINLGLFLTTFDASAVSARYSTGGTGLPLGGDLNSGTITDPYGSSAINSGGTIIGQTTTFSWSAAGVNWVEIFSGQTNATPGSKALSFGVTTFTSWTGSLAFGLLAITYTIPPCSTCTLNIQVHDGCDGSGIGNATVTLSNGLTCTTGGGGGCTISGIPDGDYTVTVTATGYTSEQQSFTCACGGGSATLTFDLDPDGGCDSCDLTVTVIDYCTGSALSGVTITAGGFECTTGAPGTCAFNNLENGDYTVVISLTGYASQTRAWRCNNGSNGAFTVALVPNGACDDPPNTNDESGACYPLAFGARELRGLQFGTAVRDTTPEFGAAELRGLRVGRMRIHR